MPTLKIKKDGKKVKLVKKKVTPIKSVPKTKRRGYA